MLTTSITAFCRFSPQHTALPMFFSFTTILSTSLTQFWQRAVHFETTIAAASAHCHQDSGKPQLVITAPSAIVRQLIWFYHVPCVHRAAKHVASGWTSRVRLCACSGMRLTETGNHPSSPAHSETDKPGYTLHKSSGACTVPTLLLYFRKGHGLFEM